MFFNSFTIEFRISSGSFPKESSVEFSVVSSAYNIKAIFLLALTMSLIKILKRSGLMIEPCGTPVNTSFIVDAWLPI